MTNHLKNQIGQVKVLRGIRSTELYIFQNHFSAHSIIWGLYTSHIIYSNRGLILSSLNHKLLAHSKRHIKEASRKS